MTISVRPTTLDEISEFRERYQSRAGCQIVHDSILPRRLADPWLFLERSAPIGYAGVWNEHYPGRIMEAYFETEDQDVQVAAIEALAVETGATELGGQTNLQGSLALVERCCSSVWTEKLLFAEPEEGMSTPRARSDLVVPGATFRRRRDEDEGPDGPWVVELGGAVVAAGGILTHYNPPYGDLYMEVAEARRGEGLGSYIVQELRSAAKEAGLVPAARCSPDNVPSRAALERGGLIRCGRLVWGALGRLSTGSDHGTIA